MTPIMYLETVSTCLCAPEAPWEHQVSEEKAKGICDLLYYQFGLGNRLSRVSYSSRNFPEIWGI
jgi:hypothetical protein